MNFYALFTGKSRLRLSFKNFRPDLPFLWRQIRIGAPSSVTQVESSVSNLVVIGLATSFGDITLAAYSVTQRLQQFVFFASGGLGQSSGILAGQNLGARRPERAKATVWWALGYVMILNILISALMFAFPQAVLSLFTRDPTLLGVAVPWLHIQVLAFLGIGTGMVFQQTFNTAGDTLMPMLVIFASLWGIQQPLALMLSGVAARWSIFGWDVPVPTLGNLGEFGIAWAIVVAAVARLTIYFPYFLWGPWMKKRVY